MKGMIKVAISNLDDFKKRKKERQKELTLSSGLTVLVEKPDTSKLLADNVLNNELLAVLFKAEEENLNDEELEKELMNDIENLKKYNDLIVSYAKITLLEPKWEEVEEYLTDQDKAEIGTWGFQKVNEEQVGIERFQKSSNDQ
jgi:hypothetical protein